MFIDVLLFIIGYYLYISGVFATRRNIKFERTIFLAHLEQSVGILVKNKLGILSEYK